MVYKQTPIHSEEFGIYQNKAIEDVKTSDSNSEILKNESRNIESDKLVKQSENVEIDYRNLTAIEKAILTELQVSTNTLLVRSLTNLKAGSRRSRSVKQLMIWRAVDGCHKTPDKALPTP